MRFNYSLNFLEKLQDYVGDSDQLEMEAHTRTSYMEGFFGSIAPYLDLQGKRMVDAGCGHGVLALGGHLMGMSVEAFDIVPKAVDIANMRFRETGMETVAFEHDLRESIPAGFSGQFDLVTNYQVLEHIPRSGQFQTLRNLCNMVKPGGFLFIDTENSLYPYDRHDTLLPLVRLLAPSFQGALVKKLGKELNFFEPSSKAHVTLHDYLSYDEIVGAATVLGFKVVNSAIPHGDMRQLFLSLTGSHWFYDNIAQFFDAERFMPVSILLQKTSPESV